MDAVYGKAAFNLEELVGMNKSEVRELVTSCKDGLKPHSLEDVVTDLMKRIPKPPKVSKK
jgi:hypothetical protein